MNTLRVAASAVAVLAIAAMGWPLGCAAGSEADPSPPATGVGTPTAVGGQGGGEPLGGTGGSGCQDELCDGLDNDCDQVVDEGCDCVEGDTQECYTGDPDLVGVGLCARGEQTCDIHGAWGDCEDEVLPVDEICNGEDDDCDGTADNGLTGTVSCGVGACLVTVPECENGAPVTCVPGQPSPTEQCEGTDDNCDGTVDEGCECAENDTQACYSFAVATRNVGECHDGVQTCDISGSWGACEGEQGPETELCNGLDDDCDASTPDGSEDPEVTQPCDGPDSDLCLEGAIFCSGTLQCSDNTAGTAEACNGDAQDEDCDGSVDEGFTRNGNPLCTDGLFNLGNIAGDVGNEVATDTWYGESWDYLYITEDTSDWPVYLSGKVELWSPPGVDFDLYVYCHDCTGGLAGSSTVTSTLGHWDVVDVMNEDDFGQGDDFGVIIEIRHKSSNRCAYWQLYVTGNLYAASQTCNT